MSAVDDVIAGVANGSQVNRLPKNKAQIGSRIIHHRWRTEAKANDIWSFNVNPNTLTADFELWVCGSADCYYLIPIAEMRAIYEHPGAYVDNNHPEIRVVDINAITHECVYGRNGARKSFAPYFCAPL